MIAACSRLFIEALRARTPTNRLSGRALRLVRDGTNDARGSAIVEFALIVPAMLMIYCALGELAAALETSRKTGSYTRTIADLVGRSQVDDTGLQTLFDAASVILAPFNVTKLKTVVSAMGVYKINGTYYGIVCSSAARNTTARQVYSVSQGYNNTILQGNAIPAAYQYDGARYVWAEVTMPFIPVLGSAFFTWINKNPINFNDSMPWPERTNTEIIMPGGKACP